MTAGIEREDVVAFVIALLSTWCPPLAATPLLPLARCGRESSPAGSQRGQLVEGLADVAAIDQSGFGNERPDADGTAGR